MDSEELGLLSKIKAPAAPNIRRAKSVISDGPSEVRNERTSADDLVPMASLDAGAGDGAASPSGPESANP